MPVIDVTDPDDPRLAAYRDLPDRALRRDGERFVCEGRWLVERLIASDFPVESVLMNANGPPLAGLSEDVPVYRAGKDLIEASIGYRFHRGALAVSRRRPAWTVDRLCAELPAAALVVQLVAVTDPDNVGAIMRCAAGLGAWAVVVDGQTHDPFYRRALRSAMGTTLGVRLVETGDAAAALGALGRASAQRVAAVARPVGAAMGGHDVVALDAVPPAARRVVVLGAEGPGLPEPVVAACDVAATIPMRGDVDSLNVAAAAAVSLYALRV